MMYLNIIAPIPPNGQKKERPRIRARQSTGTQVWKKLLFLKKKLKLEKKIKAILVFILCDLSQT